MNENRVKIVLAQILAWQTIFEEFGQVFYLAKKQRVKKKIQKKHKRNLYYFNWPLQAAVFAVVIDDLRERLSIGDEITFVSCKGSLLPCKSNLEMDSSKCTLCKFNHNGAFRDSFQNVEQVYIDDFCSKREVDDVFEGERFDNYKGLEDIKKLSFRGVNIGFGALSTYISATRNRDPELNHEFRAYFNELIKVELFIKIAIDRIIKEKSPEVITIFNGRVHDTRPVFQTAVNLGIPLRGVETIVKGEWDWYRRVFENALPHDISYHHEAINETWERSNHNKEKKEELASSFYLGRRSKQLVRDVKVYTKEQQEGMLPEGFDQSIHNVVIFNSSDDEFAAIGKEWEELNLFENQIQGIKWILEQEWDSEIRFYIRVHPNLKDVDYAYHTDLYELGGNYPSCTIIPANSPVSTYALMDAADKVIVFGSSTGMEAAFAGKPVVLLSGTFYFYLDSTYNPRTLAEAKELINNKDLPPKPKEGALRFAYYLMNFEEYSKPISTNVIPFRLFGNSWFHYFPHLTFWRSSLLHKLGMWLIRLKMKLTSSKTASIPSKEAIKK